MEYNEFLSYIKDSIQSIIGEERQVNIHKIIKNNDVELDGLTIMSKESNISPTIYLNDYYDEYTKGRSIGDIVFDIYGLYEQQYQKVDFDLSFFTDFNKIKDRIMFKLINLNSNQKLLCEVPYLQFLDLAIVFYCCIENDTLGDATVLIHTNHMKVWNVTPEDLFRYAKINTPRTLPPIITSMNDILHELLIDKLQNQYILEDLDEASCDISFDDMAKELINVITPNDRPSMYILTNTHKVNGSSCLLYKDVLKSFSQKFNSDIIILPSSIHEVILIPHSDDLYPEQLNQMINDVNSKEVNDTDILSDHIYTYSLETDQILL